MYLEYLFLTNSLNEEIENYSYEYCVKSQDAAERIIKSELETTQLSDSTAFIVRISVKGCKNSEERARHLSKIGEDFSKMYESILVRNDASAYYNQKLYPLANEFERQLRRFLYIKNALYVGDKGKKNIEDLESKDFGEIYQLLFVDDDFNKNVKTAINKGTYSKNEILNKINELQETTTWDKIVGTKNLSIVKDKFLEIKDFRNGIMHARNITYEDFKCQKQLFEKMVKELNQAINLLINSPVNKELSEHIVELFHKGLQALLESTLSVANNFISQIDFDNMGKYLLSKYSCNEDKSFNNDLALMNRSNDTVAKSEIDE